MAKPTDKDPAINMLIGGMVGKDRVETIEKGQCMTCDESADHFRNEISEKEYEISGMCQKCQDSVFGEED